MASNLKRASQTIRKSLRTRSYTMFNLQNLKDRSTSNDVDYCIDSPAWRKRRASLNDSVHVQDENIPELQAEDKGHGLKRGASVVTQSMREAVGTLRQKLRMSTRRHLRLKGDQDKKSPQSTNSMNQNTKRRHSFGIRKRNKKDVVMSSPFKIDTPTRTRNQIKTCLNMETPTRLTREVEALTANMEALSSLTPNTLQTRCKKRQSPPLTNGSLKTPRSNRRRITTIY